MTISGKIIFYATLKWILSVTRFSHINSSAEYGHAFQHLVIQELIAYIGYTHNSRKISCWRTYTGLEVDAVIGDAELAIEIKSADEIMTKHLKGLRAFHEEHHEKFSYLQKAKASKYF